MCNERLKKMVIKELPVEINNLQEIPTSPMSDKELEDANIRYFYYEARETAGKIPVLGFFLVPICAKYAVKKYIEEIREAAKYKRENKMYLSDMKIPE